jgi:hypothetical protein
LKVINKYQCSWLRMRIRFSWLWTVSSVQCHAMHPIPLLGVEAACCGKWLWCHNEASPWCLVPWPHVPGSPTVELEHKGLCPSGSLLLTDGESVL